MEYSPITSWQIDGEKMATLSVFTFLGHKITTDSDCSHKIKRLFLLGRNYMRNLDSVLKSRDTMFPTKVHVVKVMVFPVVMYGCDLDHKESWAPKNLCFWTVVLKKSLESPLDCKEIKPVNPKGDQPWIFFERTDAEAEALILWPPAVKKLTHWKWPWCCGRLRAGGEGGNRGWDGCLASLTQWTWVWANLGDSEGQGSLACYSSWGHNQSDITKWLNNNIYTYINTHTLVQYVINKYTHVCCYFKIKGWKANAYLNCYLILYYLFSCTINVTSSAG